MKNVSKKKLFVIIVLVLLILVVVGTIWNYKDKNYSKIIITNTNEGILSETQINGITIKDIKLDISDGMSTYKAKALNKTDKVIELDGFSISFFENEKDLGTIEVFVNNKIKPGQEIELVNYSDLDFTTATSAKYEMISR